MVGIMFIPPITDVTLATVFMFKQWDDMKKRALGRPRNRYRIKLQ
jgi:hypothetical protein